MANEIKAIECPKCGSVQKTEIRKDYFLCRNCGTEYVLDNDDITITHNVNYNHVQPVPVPAAQKKVLGAIGVMILIFGIAGLLLMLQFNDAGGASGIAGIDREYRWQTKDDIGFVSADGKPVMATLGQREAGYDENDKDSGKYIIFHDLLSGKEIKSQRITSIPKANNEDIKIREFSNGDIYAIVNKMHLFKIDREKMAAQDVTSKTFMHHPELTAGIADLLFVSKDYGDGFNLVTNDGRNYYYYPIVNKVYTKDQHNKAQDDLEIREEGAKVKTYFDFSSKASMYPDEPIRLMKFTQKDNAGGPNEWPYFEYGEDYTDNGKKKTMFRWGEKLVLSHEDFTPGRLYFSPEVLYSDDKYVLISYDTTAAQESNTSLQCLDAVTGKIIFTIPFGEEKYFDKNNVARYKDGFILNTNIAIVVVNMKGRVLKEHKTI